MPSHITTRNEEDKTMRDYLDYLPFLEKEMKESTPLHVDFWRFRILDEIQRLRTRTMVVDQMPLWKAKEKTTQKYIVLESKINQ